MGQHCDVRPEEEYEGDGTNVGLSHVGHEGTRSCSSETFARQAVALQRLAQRGQSIKEPCW